MNLRRVHHVHLLFARMFMWVFISLTHAVFAQTTQFPEGTDTEKSTNAVLSPEEATRKFQVPPGFKVTLFAGEPDVRQPIAMCTDDRGRLWVAENYTYSDNGAFDPKLRDRLVIFEDVDNDGRFDKRTVFWEQGEKLTSVAIGFGGVWVLCAPNLLFIPDRNQDDVPDGAPQVVLNGWATEKIQHNIVNGLMWGPDGWLYGRHGILATAAVGKPGTPEDKRIKMNCGIWRYHPIRETFEVVAHGTTNPWGMDFDEHGEAFFINTVIGHLWHVIPGAHYQRMYGQDMDPHSYQLIEQHADHYHWDTGKKWQESRDGKGLNDALGGGHAHSGLMIYLGDNWPDRYRNSIFTVNLHGYRLNNDLIVREGSGYVGKHGEDFARTSDIWFRAVDLTYGSDGGVYIIDWSDTGECHEADGVHRSSGRIYKITYGDPAKTGSKPVSTWSEPDLVKALFHKNEWFSRHARRVLQERAATGKNMRSLHGNLKKEFSKRKDIPAKLRAMWALYVTGGANEPWLADQLKHPDEHIRAWAVRFLAEQNTSSKQVHRQLSKLGREEQSAFVRLSIASALQRFRPDQRTEIALGLLSHAEDANDHNLPLMIWYGVSSLGDSDPSQLVSLADKAQMPLVRRFIARRIAEQIEDKPAALDALVASATGNRSAEFQFDIAQGIAEALKGWREADAPKGWPAFRQSVAKGSNEKLKETVRDLSLVFGDTTVITELKAVVLDDKETAKNRRSALQKLINNKRPDLLPLLQTLVTNKTLAPVAARGLAAYDDPDAPKAILAVYDHLNPADQPDVISVLVSRPAYANALLDAIAKGKMKRGVLSAYHARQISSLGDKALNEKLTRVWGEIRAAGADKEKLIAKYKGILTPERLKRADLPKGREVFNVACALCHKLYGEGASIGPDLTGSGRGNLDYLLENILDPAAIVAADFKMAVVTLKDGRVLNGVVSAQTDRTITLLSLTESTTLERSEIADFKTSETSLMPEGLLESFNETQTADLIAYLMSKEQAPLPAAKK